MKALTRPIREIWSGRRGQQAQILIDVFDTALAAPDIAHAVSPALDMIVSRTLASGAAYLQLEGKNFMFISGSGRTPLGQPINTLMTSGLPADSSLMQILGQNLEPLFVTDLQSRAGTEHFVPADVVSLAAAAVQQQDGTLMGAFLAYMPRRHRWNRKERHLFAAVTSIMSSLVARLMVEEDAIRALTSMTDRRGTDLREHTERVAELAVRLGQLMSLDSTLLLAIRQGAFLHDLGKIFIPDAIRNKPGRLNRQEWGVMRQHAEAGHQVAQQLSFLPKAALDIVLYHHERWDGHGYPYGLAGRDIPFSARIFAVCDVYDALTSLRPYKVAWSEERALSEIRMLSGTRFDPQIVNKFLQLFPQQLREPGSALS